MDEKTPGDATAACKNTDMHLWPQASKDAYAPRLFATAGGGIGIDVGGHVIVKPLEDWHSLEKQRDKLFDDNGWAANEIGRLRAVLETIAAMTWTASMSDVRTIATKALLPKSIAEPSPNDPASRASHYS